MNELDNVCCCEDCEKIMLKPCGNFIVTKCIDLGDLDCVGRIIRVPVKLRACANKKVNVAALLCDENDKLQGIKVVQLQPKCEKGKDECDCRKTEFCFPIPDTVCTGGCFRIKIIASYAPEELCPCL